MPWRPFKVKSSSLEENRSRLPKLTILRMFWIRVSRLHSIIVDVDP